jgi:hypothetical protein
MIGGDVKKRLAKLCTTENLKRLVRVLAWVDRDGLFLVGVGFVFYGIEQVYVPAAWLLAGALLIVMAVGKGGKTQ